MCDSRVEAQYQWGATSRPTWTHDSRFPLASVYPSSPTTPQWHCLGEVHHMLGLRQWSLLLTFLFSLHSLLPAELLALSCNATSSRVLDVALESPTVPIRSRKRLVTSFIEQFHLLADDRIGCRVADRCLAAADPYLKVFLDSLYNTHKLHVSVHFTLGKDCSLVDSSWAIPGGISFRSILLSKSAFTVIAT